MLHFFFRTHCLSLKLDILPKMPIVLIALPSPPRIQPRVIKILQHTTLLSVRLQVGGARHQVIIVLVELKNACRCHRHLARMSRIRALVNLVDKSHHDGIAFSHLTQRRIKNLLEDSSSPDCLVDADWPILVRILRRQYLSIKTELS